MAKIDRETCKAEVTLWFSLAQRAEKNAEFELAARLDAVAAAYSAAGEALRLGKPRLYGKTASAWVKEARRLAATFEERAL